MEAYDNAEAAFDELLVRQQRQLDARFRLLAMDEFEEVARHVEGLSSADASVAALRVTLATHYREAIGVDVQQRGALRRQLEQAAQRGDRTVGQLIAAAGAQPWNGLSSGAATGVEDWL